MFLKYQRGVTFFMATQIADIGTVYEFFSLVPVGFCILYSSGAWSDSQSLRFASSQSSGPYTVPGRGVMLSLIHI